MNDNKPSSSPTIFHHKRDSYYQDQYQPATTVSSRHRRHRKHQRNQETTVADNIIFTKAGQEQPRVHRTRSDCRIKSFYKNSRIRTCQYLDYRRNFLPFISNRIPPFYPQRRFIRSTQTNYRLFNMYHPNATRV